MQSRTTIFQANIENVIGVLILKLKMMREVRFYDATPKGF